MKKAFHRKLLSSTVEAQRMLTLAAVPVARDSWVHGSGDETIHTLAGAFEARLGVAHQLYIGADYRVLGETMKDIREMVKRLHKARVEIIDLSNPDDTLLDSYNRAQVGLRWNGDRRSQKNKGRKGGTAKGVRQAEARASTVPEAVVRRLVYHTKLTLKDCSEILGEPFGVSTLRRHYYKR